MPEPQSPSPTEAPPDPVADAFAGLIRALAAEALSRSDAGDDAGFERALNFRAAADGMRRRWVEGQPSAVRRAAKAEG